MTKPPDLADIEEQIEMLGVEKDAVVAQDYEKAADLRDQAEKLRAEKDKVQKEWRDSMSETAAAPSMRKSSPRWSPRSPVSR